MINVQVEKESQKTRILQATTLISNITAEVEEGHVEDILSEVLDCQLNVVRLLHKVERKRG